MPYPAGAWPRGSFHLEAIRDKQWVLSFPKRLRYFLHRGPALIGPVLRIFLEAV